MNERVNKSIFRSILNATRTGNGFNKIMRTDNGFNKVIMYILPEQERELLFNLKQLEHAFVLNLMFAACVRGLQDNSATRVA